MQVEDQTHRNSFEAYPCTTLGFSRRLTSANFLVFFPLPMRVLRYLVFSVKPFLSARSLYRACERLDQPERGGGEVALW